MGSGRLLRVAVALLSAILVGCDAAAPSPSPEGVWILTSDPTVGTMGCRMADNRGVLIAHPLTGLGIAGTDGQAHPVRWPYGFSATVDAGRLALVDRQGLIVAHEGDQVTFGGGDGPDGITLVCPATVDKTS